MDRTNVETVISAGKVRKWKGQLLDVDLNRLRRDLENSRDFLFSAAGGRLRPPVLRVQSALMKSSTETPACLSTPESVPVFSSR